MAIRLAITEQFTKAFSPRNIDFVEIGWGHLNDADIDNINNTCDLFVIAGGGYIFIDKDGEASDRMKDLPMLQRVTCPKVAYGIGLNQLMHEDHADIENLPQDTREKIRLLGETCDMMGVRDPNTQKLFDLYSRTPATLTGDPALFLNWFPTVPSPLRGPKRPTLGINLAAHGWRAIAVLKPLLPAFVSFLKVAVQKYEANLVYFLHHELERPVVALLKDNGFAFDVVDCDPASMIAQYATVDFVVCQMLHACILAANAGVPFLNIAYDQKSISFCSLLSVPECVISHGEAVSGLGARFEQLYSQRKSISETIKHRKRDIQLASERFLARTTTKDRAPSIRGQASE